MGEAVLLIALGGARVFLGVSIGPLRRRRTFEPDRVREAPSSSLAWPLWLAGGGPLPVVASLIHGWLDFVDGKNHPTPTAEASPAWGRLRPPRFALPPLPYL